jgi:hypothetical protein
MFVQKQTKSQRYGAFPPFPKDNLKDPRRLFKQPGGSVDHIAWSQEITVPGMAGAHSWGTETNLDNLRRPRG